MVFRGCGKSTILGIRNAHKYRANPLHQLLVQGADDDLTDDISRDTIAIMRSNALVPRESLVEPAGVRHWFTRQGLDADARTPQFRGRGILSRVTGNRADEIINDDTEMSKNVEDEKARAKLRKRLSEQGFILKPGGSVLWVGTPHTHDSIYDQKIAAGAESLIIPLFASQTRHDLADHPHHRLWFDGEPGSDGLWVFVGIGKHARLLSEGADYTVEGREVVLCKPIHALVDICHGNAWPERFHRAEMLDRRRDCETTNYWDQQYGLQAKPLKASRLNPDRLPLYAAEPTYTSINKIPVCLLGKAKIVGASLRWDPASGNLHSDTSALALVLQDEHGVRYWHRAEGLTGEVAVFDEHDHKTITGGQVTGICDMVQKFRIRRVTVETNGIGGFAPTVLRAALKQRGIRCAVVDERAITAKNKRILEAFEPLMLSRMLWVHVSVADGPMPTQMRQWNPAITQQPDDYLDAGAGAVTEQPERLDHSGRIRHAQEPDDWRPGPGVFEAELEV